jgi:hypothetical protein
MGMKPLSTTFRATALVGVIIGLLHSCCYPFDHSNLCLPLCSDDHWSIHKGSCGYGWLDKSVSTGDRLLSQNRR